MTDEMAPVQTVNVSLSEVEYWADIEARQLEAEAQANALLAGKRARPEPKVVLELLDQCDVPASVLELARRALMGVKMHRRPTFPTLQAEDRPTPRNGAVRFEAKYMLMHGKRPSVQGVSMEVYGASTQRKKVDSWRADQTYQRDVEAEFARLKKKVADNEDTRRKARAHNLAQDEAALLRVMNKAPSVKRPSQD